MLLLPALHLLIFILATTSAYDGPPQTTILFTTLGRSRYAFDIFSLPVRHPTAELQHTDSDSVNYNGHFASLPASLSDHAPDGFPLLYVSERNGSTSNIYLDAYQEHPSRRSVLEASLPKRPKTPLLGASGVSMKDRPSIVGDHLIYVSTHENPGTPRESWAAVYSTNLKTSETTRLTPPGVADFSPAVSPSGEWTAVASSGERGWTGEIEDLVTDIYMFRTQDGSARTRVVKHGGWPCWADESTLYFHRESEDGWWSVYRVSLRSGSDQVVERVTPRGLHAFTPATAPGAKFLAVATRRPTSEFRHIEFFDLTNKAFSEVTKVINPHAHHYNPFVSPDSTRVGYHRCSGSGSGRGDQAGNRLLLLENVRSPLPEISLFRIDGSFPSFSPDGNQVAFVGLPGLYVANRDGSGRREIFPGTAFSTAWDPKRKGVIYTSYGPTFAEERTGVDVMSVHVGDTGQASYKKLTTGGKNNAFPSPSPDGKLVVFRSGRSGHKNLYIMDAAEGERKSLARLTEGNWTDTMCNWSPDGKWIAFASDRDWPGSGSFAIYLVRPDGTGLRKVLESGVGGGGRANHPWFSPDSRRLVFTSDYSAVSGEPVANPHHYQPYGEIFVTDVDGTHITRLTHNSYEDGTPTWGPSFVEPADVVEGPTGVSPCKFDDCHWLAPASSRAGVWTGGMGGQSQCGGGS